VSAVVGIPADPAGPISPPPKPLFDRVRAWRFLPLETYPGIVALVQTPVGKVLLFVLFATLLRPFGRLWLPVTIAAAAAAYAGQYRSRVVTLATLYVLFLYPGWIDWTPASLVAIGEGVDPQIVRQLNVVMLVLFFSFCAVALYCVRSWRNRPIVRRPILSLHVAFMLLLLLGASGWLHGMPRVALWSFIATFGAYFWFLCYALKDMRSKDASSIPAQFGVFHPFWGSSMVPFGKGAAYLRKVEAKNSLDLAVSQLKGLKLMMWVWVLVLISLCMRLVAVDHFHTPTLDEALARHMAGNPYPWRICWGSIAYTFFGYMGYVAIFGDTCVACARVAGYPILRNSCRPLSAKTLVDFWNRYFYYFKELLVEIFFFPTFLKCFKRYTPVRVFFATFMAAAVGNWIFHFIKGIESVPRLGLLNALVHSQNYVFYCVVLATGIGLSQMQRRGTARHHRGWLRGEAMPALGVILFYCVLEVFMYPYSPYSLKAHFSFLFHCFGVDGWI
jgi:hypothetical protein